MYVYGENKPSSASLGGASTGVATESAIGIPNCHLCQGIMEYRPVNVTTVWTFLIGHGHGEDNTEYWVWFLGRNFRGRWLCLWSAPFEANFLSQKKWMLGRHLFLSLDLIIIFFATYQSKKYFNIQAGPNYFFFQPKAARSARLFFQKSSSPPPPNGHFLMLLPRSPLKKTLRPYGLVWRCFEGTAIKEYNQRPYNDSL